MSNSLLTIEQLGRNGIDEILALAARFQASAPRDLLSDKTVVSCFFEDSTRTRVSFELAATNLGASVVQFAAGASSLRKGESLRNTVETISAMGPDALIVRHKHAGVPQQIASWTSAAVLNAGDGAHEHPTQALLDSLTLTQALGRSDLDGVSVAIVGDFDHSRVAASCSRAFRLLGADVTIVGPPTLVTKAASWPVSVEHDLDAVISKVDVVYTIRPQAERMTEAFLPSMRDYTRRYSVNDKRFASMGTHALVLEAGPLVPGVQMSQSVAAHERCLMNQQVTNGVPVRMACLALLLGGDRV